MNSHFGSARNSVISNKISSNVSNNPGNSVIHKNVMAACIPATKSRSCSKRLAACIAPMMLALVAMPLRAATEFEDSIPIELARLFLGNPGTGGATIYQDIMDEFPPFTVPDTFEVMGSLDQVYVQRVVLRTDLDEDAAKTAITGTLTASGWQLIDFNNFRPGQQGGFVSATQPELPVQVCHDDYGMMQIGVSTSAEGQLINLTRSPAAIMRDFGGGVDPMGPCDPARFGPGNVRGPGGRGGVMAHMPTLVVPETPALRNMPGAFFGGGSGGGQDDYEARTPLSSELSLQELYRHFAEQLIEQGWAADNGSVGNFLATGGFTKTVEGDVELIGILTVLEVAENGFDLKFRLLRKGNSGAAGGVVIRTPALGIQGRAP